MCAPALRRLGCLDACIGAERRFPAGQWQVENSDLHWRVEIIDSSMKDARSDPENASVCFVEVQCRTTCRSSCGRQQT